MQRHGVAPSSVLSGKHVRVGFDRFEHGIIKRRLREGQSEDADDWKIGHPVVFPNFLKVGGGYISTFQLRTPVDDETTMYFWYSFYEVPAEFTGAIDASKRCRNTIRSLQHRDARSHHGHDRLQGEMVWATRARARIARAKTCRGERAS